MERATTQPQQAPPVAEELNLDYVKRQTQSLQEAISRILEDFEAYSQTNTTPKWSHPRDSTTHLNVNAENASILPVMLASKLLPEMETDNNVKTDQLLQDVQSLPVPMQIETLKERIGRIAEACENAGKVLADARKAYGLAPQRGGPSMLPTTMDKAQAAKIREQENMLRAAVNEGEGLRLPPEQRQITTALPPHMVDALFVNDAVFNSSGMMQTHQSQSQQPEQHQQQQQGGYGSK
ncbi:unnamed protein product [Brassica rapa subsp. trilocularis]